MPKPDKQKLRAERNKDIKRLLRRTHRYEYTKTICSHARWCPVYERI